MKEIGQRKLKILYVQAFPGGGSLIALHDMLRHIDKSLIEPVVLCYYKNQHTAKLEEIPACKIIYLPESSSGIKMSSKKKYGKVLGVLVAQKNVLKKYFVDDKKIVDLIYKTITEVKPDIVHHNNDVIANRADIRAAAKAKIVSVVHNRSLLRYQKNFSGYLLDFFLSRKAAYSINISEAVRERHDQLFRLPTRLSVTINDFIDVPKYLNEPEKKLVRKKLAIDDKCFLITNIGRIIGWKGQHVLIEAIQLIKTRLGDFRVLLVGSTEIGIGSERYNDYLKQLACRYRLQDHVLFTGHREDVAAIMHASDVIVHTAVQPEPQGLVIIEALLCNKLVIASNAGGAAELVNKYGGMLVEPGNAQALARTLLQLYENHESGSPAGYTIHRQQLLEDFNAENQAKEMLKIYQRVKLLDKKVKNII